MGRRLLKNLETTVLAALVALSVMAFPGPPDTSLDASWQTMLIHAHERGLQFGRDVIFTWGPWGFLFTSYHLGASGAALRIGWEASGLFLMVLALMVLVRPLPMCRRILFALVVMGANWLFQDLFYFALITLAGISGLMRREASVPWVAGWALALGFISQVKFTYFALSSAAVAASIACWLLRRSRRNAAASGLAFAAGTLGSWILAGQDPDHLYPYVMRSLQIAGGYADAMGIDETWPVFLLGACLAVACALFLRDVWRRTADSAFGYPAAAFVGFCMYVAWKEGFTRADGHVLGFFGFIMVLSTFAAPLLLPGRRFHWFDGTLLVGLLGIAVYDPASVRLAAYITRGRITSSLSNLGHLGSLSNEWQRQYAEASRAAALPRIRREVGAGTVDVYNFNTATPILNGMNLSARPIFQSYSAYTPSLEGWNLRFYQSDRAPEYLLWSDDPVDGRYPGQDDGMLLARLPGHYEPLFKEAGYWLFRRVSPVSREPLAWVLLDQRSVSLSEEIPLPGGVEKAIWLRADAVPDNLGRIRAALYKPALINIVVTDNFDRTFTMKMLPRVARDGFILSPTLWSGGDMAALMAGRAQTRVKSFHFEAPNSESEFWSHVDVLLYRIPGLPARLE